MSKLSKVTLALFVAVCGAILAYRIYLASLSDETRIRNLLQSVAEAFNDASASRISDRLTADFSVEKGDFGRREVHAFLVHFFLRERDRKSGEPLWRVEVKPEEVDLSIEGGEKDGPPTARVEVTARFSRQSAANAESPEGAPVIVVFTGKLVKAKGRWLIDSAERRLLGGRWPF